ncbi:TIGR01459 family HAD-type hydrolase [Dactylosporangium fulvum]|uniref:TIGR01459 family HAD-type hydrolase n=1 Tax=Dactylosporangium fulvum TaxID=53359 RepID=A0ABY5VRX2_9ACTN|nr:TIGR01459 family HAD-type hydrolase [Dactylosporangium fulvum]UWP79947.1 TIGR01459 family HAD-type hydrolase [Dactylosporangium fulvum]
MTVEITGIGDVVAGYDAVLVDVWGVLIDGVRPFPLAVDCLRNIRAGGRAVGLISNTSRSAGNLARMLDAMGIPRDLYDVVLTSGELARQALSRRAPASSPRWRRYLHLGSRENTEWLSTTGITEVEDPDDADVIVATGILTDPVSHPGLRLVLTRARSRELPMICANPDREVLVGGRRHVAVGAVADAYEKIGGDVVRYGKPEPPIYAHFRTLPGFAAPRRILAVGDAKDTDVLGAARAGLDTTLVVGTGLHRLRAATDPALPAAVAPTYSIEQFAW